MKLIDHVCSLELSMKLKGIGVKQESIFRWQQISDDCFEPTSLKKEYIEKNNHYPENYSAFTSSELGDLLPWDLLIARNKDKKWHIFFMGDGLPSEISENASIMSEEKEADSRALMLIYLIENKLIKELTQ